ncbi:MAG: hypothetical protein ACRCVA_26610 [Phreatobacter sp.]
MQAGSEAASKDRGAAVKTVALFVFAFVLSAFVACTVVQIGFDVSQGVFGSMLKDVEYVGAYMAAPFLALACLAVLACCYWLGSEPRALDLAALIVAGLLFLQCLINLGIDAQTHGSARALRDGLPLFGSIALSCGLMIFIQWWLVRRRFLKKAVADEEPAPNTDRRQFHGPYSH